MAQYMFILLSGRKADKTVGKRVKRDFLNLIEIDYSKKKANKRYVKVMLCIFSVKKVDYINDS